MTFTEAVRTCVAKTFVWRGRASRSEYWWFVLATVLAAFAGAVLIYLVTRLTHSPGTGRLVRLLVEIAIFLPNLAVTIRRLHDTGRNGAWYLISFVPCAGGIVLLIFMLLPGEPVANEYGPDPLRPQVPRMAPRPAAPASTPGDRRCVRHDCQMKGIVVDRGICVGCGEPTQAAASLSHVDDH